jgi:hypothetical protein
MVRSPGRANRCSDNRRGGVADTGAALVLLQPAARSDPPRAASGLEWVRLSMEACQGAASREAQPVKLSLRAGSIAANAPRAKTF